MVCVCSAGPAPSGAAIQVVTQFGAAAAKPQANDNKATAANRIQQADFIDASHGCQKSGPVYGRRIIKSTAKSAYWVCWPGMPAGEEASAGVEPGDAVRGPMQHIEDLLAEPLVRWIVVIAGLSQIAGIGVFFHTMWSRIRPVGSQVREARGERF